MDELFVPSLLLNFSGTLFAARFSLLAFRERRTANDGFYFFAVVFLFLPTAFFFAGAFALAFAFGLGGAAFATFSPAAGAVPADAPFLFFSASTISRCAMRRT